MATLTGAIDVGDTQDQANAPSGVEDNSERNVGPEQAHQLDDDQEQESTPSSEQISSEQEPLPVSRESASTVESEYNSNQFIMENYNFSFTSINERTATPETFFCRICHQRSLSEPNLSPCNCRGTMGFIHKSCLEQWLAASDSNKCELCHFSFTVKRQPKFGILKAIRIWLLSEECRTERLLVILDMIRLVVSLPFIFFINHLTAALFEIFHFEDTDTCDFYSLFKNMEAHLDISSMKDVAIITGRLLTYFSVGFTSAMDVFAVGWLISRIEEHYQLWHKWYRTQCDIQVILPDSSEQPLENK